MAAYHLEIRDVEDGRTVTQVDCEVRKVSDIEAVRSEDSLGILVNGESTAVGYLNVEQAKHSNFELHRWPLGEAGKPVVTKIDGPAQKKANQ